MEKNSKKLLSMLLIVAMLASLALTPALATEIPEELAAEIIVSEEGTPEDKIVSEVVEEEAEEVAACEHDWVQVGDSTTFACTICGETEVASDEGVMAIPEEEEAVGPKTFEVGTAEELTKALADVNDGDMIELTADVETDDIIFIDKSITVNGNGHTITSKTNRIVRIKASNIAVTLNDTKFISEITGSRGIQVDAENYRNVNLNINNCEVTVDYYAVNLAGNTDKQEGTSNITLNINDSKLTGWAAMQIFAKDSEIKAVNSELSGNSRFSGPSDDYGVIAFASCTPASEYNGWRPSNTKLTLEDCKITAGANGTAYQSIIRFPAQAIDVAVEFNGDNSTIISGDKAQLWTDERAKMNSLSITGGTFPSDVSAYLDPSMVQGEDGKVVPRTEGDAVAEINGKYYATLQDAIRAAKDRDTVRLVKDLTLPDKTESFTEYNLPDGAVLDLGGYSLTTGFTAAAFQGKATIQNGKLVNDPDYAIWIGNGTVDTEITLKNIETNGGVNVYAAKAILEECTIDASTKTHYAAWADSGNAEITIVSGTYIGGKNGFVVNVSAGVNNDGTVTPGTVNIQGGDFTGNVTVVTKDGSSGKVAISGGTFSSDVKDYVVEGAQAVEGADGKWTVGPKTDENTIATVGNVAYDSLQKAIAAAKDGDTVKLLKDVTINEELLISRKSNITLDGGNHTITAEGAIHAIQVWRSTGVKVNNVTITGGSSENDMKDALLVNQGSEVTASNLTTEGGQWGAVNVDKGSKFTLTSGTLNHTNKIWTDDAGSTVNVPSGWHCVTIGGKTFYSNALTLSITPSRTSMTGAGTVTLTVATNAEGAAVTVSGPEGVNLTRSADGTYTASLPNTTAAYTFTAAVGDMTATCTVSVTRYASSGGGSGSSSSRPSGGGSSSRPSGGGTVEIEDPDVPLGRPMVFADVKENDWFYKNVRYVFDHNIMSGHNDTTFAPEENTTRGMMAQIFYNIEKNPSAAQHAGYTDMNGTEWYGKAVSWASGRGIIAGYEDGSFRGETNISRQDLIAMLWRYAGSPKGSGSLNAFRDADSVAPYAQEAMRWAIGRGIIYGRGQDAIEPEGLATRAEVAAIFQRYLESLYL